MYLNCTNMYPLGFDGLIECRLLNIFEPGVCSVWIMCLLSICVKVQGVPRNMTVCKRT